MMLRPVMTCDRARFLPYQIAGSLKRFLQRRSLQARVANVGTFLRRGLQSYCSADQQWGNTHIHSDKLQKKSSHRLEWGNLVYDLKSYRSFPTYSTIPGKGKYSCSGLQPMVAKSATSLGMG